MNARSVEFKKKSLPPKYIIHDRLAVAHVVTEIRTQLKHVRNKARNVLLTGLISSVSPTYIPNLPELCRIFWKHCRGTKTGYTDDTINETIDTLTKIRIGYLRLATVVNFLDLDSRNVSQWDQIDSQLDRMRQEVPDYEKR